MRDPKERLRDIPGKNPALFSEALRDAAKPISPPRTLIGWMLPRL
jgi:hypothetical protein